MVTPAELHLASQAAAGNLEALHELVFVTYRAYLCGVLKRYDADSSDDDIEEALHAFYDYLTTPTSDGSYRLRNIGNGDSPRIYLARALDNRLHDLREARNRMPLVYSEIEAGRASDDADGPVSQSCKEAETYDADDRESLAEREAEIKVLVMTLEKCGILSARDRYILFTYLLAERFSGEGRPLRLSEMLGKQLGMKPSTVYNCYDRSIKRLRSEAQKLFRKITDTQ